MKAKERFYKFVFCAILAATSIGGTPLRAEKVEELMRTMNQPVIAHTLRDDDENEN